MFSVLIPAFYAGSVHGLWVGLGVGAVMAVLIQSINLRYLASLIGASEERLEKELDPKDPMGRLVTYRMIAATIVCILIGLSGTETCHFNTHGTSECHSVWKKGAS